MQKAITSFFGGPSGGAGTPPSPSKPRPPKPAPKPKAKPRAKPKGGAASIAKGKAAEKVPKSPTKDNAKGLGAAEKRESPFKRANGKRKSMDSEEDGKGDKVGEKEEEEKEEEEEEEEEEAPVPSKRLRRLAKRATVEESDDDMFGDGEGMEKGFDAKKTEAMEVDGDGKDNKKKAKASAVKTVKAYSKASSKASGKADGKTDGKANGKAIASAKAVETQEDEDDEAETADEGCGDEDDDEEHEPEEEEEKEERKTMSSVLMDGANKAATATAAAKKGTKATVVVPSKIEDLISKASWKKGQPVPFEALAAAFDKVEQTSKRLEIQEILRGFLCTVIALTPEDLVPCVYLACNEVAPAYERLELGIGDAVLQKAIQGATGRSAKDIKAAAQKVGDLGEVAQHSTKSQRTLAFGQVVKSLSARDILERYRAIARVKGNMSQDDKINRIKKMLVSCKGLQAKYIIRGLQGKMRIGLSNTTVMVSLSHAAVTCPSEAALAAEKAENILAAEKTTAAKDDGEDGPTATTEDSSSKEGLKAGDKEPGGGEEGTEEEGETDGLIPVARELRDAKTKDSESRMELATLLVKQAYSECPNIDILVKAILSNPLYRLQQICRLTPGVPVFPMLAKPTKSIGEVMQRLSGLEFTCEYKYDGVRAQVHLMPDGVLRFFSRNSKDSSSELPDLIPVMKGCAADTVHSYVIDTEVVAYDRDTGNLLPFQMLSTRGRKDVDADDVKVKVIVEAFDILYLNGKSLLQRPLQERRKALRSSFKEVDGRFRFATFMDHKEDGDTGPIEEFLSEAVKGNCEGLMVKTLTVNASYEPSKRSLNWLKLKKDYLQSDGGGVGDSLDLVPIAAYFGKGKRTGKYGAYLLACYEPDREEYQSVCKIGTGFTDEILMSFWTELREHTVDKRPRYYNVAESIAPDVWLEPKKVWEVKCADLSKSPVHKAAIGKLEPDRGISIRFPRLLREREDKDPEQATTSDQILDMYESQDVVKSNAGGAQANDNDDDWEL